MAAVSLQKPVKIFVNESTDVALNLRQEFLRIRPNREGDREAIVCGMLWILLSNPNVLEVLMFSRSLFRPDSQLSVQGQGLGLLLLFISIKMEW